MFGKSWMDWFWKWYLMVMIEVVYFLKGKKRNDMLRGWVLLGKMWVMGFWE